MGILGTKRSAPDSAGVEARETRSKAAKTDGSPKSKGKPQSKGAKKGSKVCDQSLLMLIPVSNVVGVGAYSICGLQG